MRKAGIIILTFLYLAFTAGVSMQRHYCMNRMSGVRFAAHPEEHCSVCGMERAERGADCCRDEVSLFKITDDQQPPFSGELSTPEYLYIHSSAVVINADIYTTFTSSGNFADHGPPGQTRLSIFLRNCVFRI